VLERFTDRSRRVLVLAQEEARRTNRDVIGTEHLLLGLLDEGEGVAARALEAMDVSSEAVRSAVERKAGPRGTASAGAPQFTPRAKKVIELAFQEALALGHRNIGTSHVLLGLIRGDGVAREVLTGLGVDLSRVRDEVVGRLSGEVAGAAPPMPDELEAAHREVRAARWFVRQLAAEVKGLDADTSTVELVDRILPMLARMHALHGEALGRLIQMIETWRGEIFLDSMRRDDLVGPLLAAHGLGSADSGHRFMVSEILQVMYWLRGEGRATAVEPAVIERLTGRSAEELAEWFELMTKMGLVEREGDSFRLTAEGVQDGSRLFGMD
jgi:hypothetical protein